MKEQLEEQKNNFLLDVRAAVRRNQVVVIILYYNEIGHYNIMHSSSVTDVDNTLKSLCELPFLGRISPENTFKDWEDYFDDVALAEIYGFELEDGMAQISILDHFIMPSENKEIHEAYCHEELSERLFKDGYHGDNMNGLHIPNEDEYEFNIDKYFISMSCALRWLREVKGVYINIRMTFYEHVYTQEPKLHYIAEIFDMNSGQWHDNDIWEETYEKCVEAAINYYYDYIERRG